MAAPAAPADNAGAEARAQAALAEAAFAEGRTNAGDTHMRRALALEPMRLDRRLLLGRRLAAAGCVTEARAEFEAVAAAPEVAASYLAQVGVGLAGLGAPERAAAVLAAAVERAGEAAPAAWRTSWLNQLDRLAPAPDEIEAYLANRRLAETVLLEGLAVESGEARQAFAGRLDSVRGQLSRAMATQAARRGEAAFARGEVAAGAADLRAAIALNPKRLELRVLLARLLARSGEAETSAAELEIVAGDPEASAANLAQAGAVMAAIDRPGPAADLFARAIAANGDDAPATWRATWCAQMDRLALEAPGAAGFLANRHETAAQLRRTLAKTPPPAAAAALLNLRLIQIHWQIDDPNLIELGEQFIAALIVEGGAREAGLAAPFLKEVVSRDRLLARLAAAREADPGRAELSRAEVTLNLGDKVALARLWPELLATPRSDDLMLDELVGLAAYDLGHWREAFPRLSAGALRRDSIDMWWRAGQCALYLGRDADAEAAFAHVTRRLPDAAVGQLSEALAPLLEAVNHLYVLADGVDPRALAARLKQSLKALKEKLAPDAPWSPAALVDAAWELRLARQEPFAYLAMVKAQHGFIARFDARYGTLDLDAFAVVHRALAEHEAALLEAAADALVAGAPPGGLQVVRDLPARLTDVLLELDRPGRARERLDRLRRCGLEGRQLLASLERCDLQQGVLAAPPWREPTASAHPILQADDWHARELLDARTVWREAGIAGPVERARLDGTIERFVHRTRPFSLAVTEVGGLEVRDSELVIGPRGGLLRPSDWHMISGVFPDRHEVCEAAAKRAAVLRRQPLEIVETPVLVLAGADPVSVPNYYHWMIHQLARAIWALREGWLEARRLVVPAASRTWMFEALRLAGLDESRLLVQPASTTFRFTDAWMVSAFEHPGASLLREVRERMWAQAGVKADAAPRRDVFLTRPLGVKAPAYEAAALLKVVEAAGFECLDPSELGIADQVRLMADARAIAGFDGAALANLMFARPGVKVLDLTCEVTHWPDFTGIAIALGQRFRYLSCAVPPPCRAPLFLNMAPVQCDLKLLERELRWARER